MAKLSLFLHLVFDIVLVLVMGFCACVHIQMRNWCLRQKQWNATKLGIAMEVIFVKKIARANGKSVPKAEAKDCHKVWNCKGENRCWEDCRNRYNGMGLCDLYTAPSVPKQCFCAYKC
ncbi:hypothetical protein POUND7_000323 [Theobroma cacao]